MNKCIIFILAYVFVSCGTAKMIPTPDVISEVQENKSKEVIAFAQEANVSKTLKYLTSDELEGRDSGSKGIEKASVYLENLLRENGINPYFKTYRDTLSNFDKTSYNIVGYIEGTDPILKNEFVIIGAHYDHIGKISAVNGDDIANGANDNAAGTTSVSEVAKYFAKAKSNKRSLLFVFFSAEEKGLLGSKHLAAKLKQQNIIYIFFFFDNHLCTLV